MFKHEIVHGYGERLIIQVSLYIAANIIAIEFLCSYL